MQTNDDKNKSVDSINDRIELIIKELGFNKNSFSKKIGLDNNTTITNIVSGRRSKPSYDLLNKIILSFDSINSEWLLTGEGPMLKKDFYKEIITQLYSGSRAMPIVKGKKGPGKTASLIDLIKNDYTSLAEEAKAIYEKSDEQPKTSKPMTVINQKGLIPFYELRAEAGLPSSFNNGDPKLKPDGYYMLPDISGDDVFITDVWGDSMHPKFNSGDKVICREIKELLYIQWGRTYLIETRSQGIIIKRIKPVKGKEEMIQCESINEAYDPFTIPKSDIKMIAIVIAHLGKEG